jgi:hypothetical protein
MILSHELTLHVNVLADMSPYWSINKKFVRYVTNTSRRLPWLLPSPTPRSSCLYASPGFSRGDVLKLADCVASADLSLTATSWARRQPLTSNLRVPRCDAVGYVLISYVAIPLSRAPVFWKLFPAKRRDVVKCPFVTGNMRVSRFDSSFV